MEHGRIQCNGQYTPVTLHLLPLSLGPRALHRNFTCVCKHIHVCVRERKRKEEEEKEMVNCIGGRRGARGASKNLAAPSFKPSTSSLDALTG